MRYIALALLFFQTISFGAQGFSTDIAKTFAEAKREKKLVLIDFFGIWCPPCNQLDETVFETSAFSRKAKAFKLLKIDADKKSSWELKDKYRIGGYPTVVFTDAKGDEIYRVVGYRDLKEFLSIMDMVLGNRKKGFESACKSKNTDDIWRCAVISSEREDKKTAEKAYRELESVLKPGSARYTMARTYSVEHSPTEDLKRDGFERLMKEEPESPMAMQWATEYLDLFQNDSPLKPKTEILEKVAANYPKMVRDPSKEEMGIPVTDLAQMRAEVLAKIGKTDEAKAAWKEAAGIFEKEATHLPKGSPARGFTIERIGCLEESGDTDGALKLANEYRQKFPEEFTFHFQAANMLQRQRKFNEAIPVAQKAYSVSYGDNKIRAATLLINLMATIPDKEAAKKIYQEVTAEVNPSAALHVRTHRYLTKLSEALKKVGS